MDSPLPSTLSSNFHLYSCISTSQSYKDGNMLKLCVKFSHFYSPSVAGYVNGCRPAKPYLQFLSPVEQKHLGTHFSLLLISLNLAYCYLIQFHVFQIYSLS